MKDKLITVATHTFERAQVIKNKLESADIPCSLKNINLIQGAFSGGVKVRILEADLDRALAVIETINENLYLENKVIEPEENIKRILVPIDFSEHSLKAAKFAVNIGRESKSEIVLLHTYFNPVINTLPFTESFTYNINLESGLKAIETNVYKEMDNLYEKYKYDLQIDNNNKSKIHKVILEGIPEDTILDYADEFNPNIIIMGTRGQAKKQNDLIGSVTAEIIDRAKVPVLAIPENSQLKSLSDINQLAYLLNFDQRDFLSFQRLVSLFEPYNIHYTCVHFAQQHSDPWDSAKIEGFRKVLQDKFANNKLDCRLLEGNDFLISLEQFIRDINVDLICLTIHKRNLFSRMFNPGIARKMLFHTDTPLLIFHHKTH